MLAGLIASAALAVVGGELGGEPAAVAVGTAGGAVPVVCTGVALHPRWVLTAAHCLDLLAGASDRVVYDEGRPVPWLAASPHPAHDGSPGHDLALIELTGDLDSWLQLAETPVPEAGERITFTGFGATNDGALDAGTRREADLGILSVDATTLRAYAAATNLCSGDSGAPGFVDGALVALGTEVTPTCLGGQTVATLLAPSIDWITSTVPPAPPPESPGCTEWHACGCASAGSGAWAALALAAAALLRQRATSTSRTGSARS
jgi:MYXO-CTERM domain-containing protein